jgi:sugar phosphate isomerase/epimerase
VGVTLGLTPDGAWSASLDEVVEAASAAGFDALGIGGDAAGPEAREAWAAAGLACEEVLALVVTEDAPAVLAQAERLAAAAEAMGAHFVLSVYAAPLSATTAPTIAAAAAAVASVGARLAVEFSPLGPVATLPLAREVVAAAGGPSRAGVMIDSWHFLVGDSTFEDLDVVPLEEVAYVQFADALAPTSEKLGRETMKRRALPGEGVLELERFATTLLARGYDGLVSLEVLSEAWRAEPLVEFCAAAHATALPYWR